jgi:hypothetical protein
VFYVHRSLGDARWSEPIRVNSGLGSAIAKGTIRGAQVAIGADNTVHVAWNGSQAAKPKGPNGELALLYTRLAAGASGFEPQRNVIREAYGLDGGTCIAADPTGNVFIAWHAGPGQEDSRRVWLVHSTDNGQTFGEERAVDPDRVGACGCCGMCGTVSPDGELMLLYRSAREDVHRDMYLLSSGDQGETFSSRKLHDWTIDACPMSSESFVHGDGRSWAAWETGDQVYFAEVGSTKPIATATPPGHGPPQASTNGAQSARRATARLDRGNRLEERGHARLAGV